METLEYFYQPAKNNNNKGTIVFCHGFAADYNYYNSYSNQLSDNDYYAVVLPGHGSLPYKNEELCVSHYGKVLANWIKEKNLKKIILMGHSMGGAVVAVACMYLSKDIVNKLIIISPMNRASTYKGISYLIKFKPKKKNIEKHIIKFNTRLNYKRESPYDNPVNGKQLFDNEYSFYVKHLDAFSILHKQMIKWSEMKVIKKAYRSLQVPTYLIVGEKDCILPVNITIRKLKKDIKNLTTIQFLRTGHLPFIERPIDYFNVVQSIIDDKQLKKVY